MGVSGYNSPTSSVWHTDQRCSGTFFNASEEMDSKVAENRGLKPCGNCTGGEWPHQTEAEEADRDPDEWVEKMEPRETAIKLRDPEWHGPEFAGLTEDGELLKWPLGLDRNVRAFEEPGSAFESDIKDPNIKLETVQFEETPLTDYYDDG